MMTNEQKAKLMSILGREKASLASIDIKYRAKRDSIKNKYISMWKKSGHINDSLSDYISNRIKLTIEKYRDYVALANSGNDKIEKLMTNDSTEVLKFIGFLMDSVSKSNKIAKLSLYKNITKLSEHLVTLTNSEINLERTANYYNSYGWYMMFVKDFKGALTTFNRGLVFSRTNIYLKANIPHALFFQGNHQEAKKIYHELKDKEFDVGRGFKTTLDAFITDFKEFEEAGIIPIEMMKEYNKMKAELGLK